MPRRASAASAATRDPAPIAAQASCRVIPLGGREVAERPVPSICIVCDACHKGLRNRRSPSPSVNGGRKQTPASSRTTQLRSHEIGFLTEPPETGCRRGVVDGAVTNRRPCCGGHDLLLQLRRQPLLGSVGSNRECTCRTARGDCSISIAQALLVGEGYRLPLRLGKEFDDLADCLLRRRYARLTVDEVSQRAPRAESLTERSLPPKCS